jgi:hypothetical protein
VRAASQHTIAVCTRNDFVDAGRLLDPGERRMVRELRCQD